ncbi:hypothetical protein BDW72DRAFT_203830 [Aspergillus terricola var. indicus]
MRSTSFLTATFLALGFALAEDHATTSSSSGTTPATGTPSTCYNLDGSEASDQVPCGTGDSVNCCHEGDICLSNGLCYQQGDRGMYKRDTGMMIVNVSFGDEPQYCCGSVSTQGDDGDDDDDDDNSSEGSCEFGDPFTIPAGTAIPDIAGLSSTSEPHADGNTDDSDANSHSASQPPARMTTPLAIALGVGIPLGLILMGFILWAVWERRRRQLCDEEAERVLGANGMALAGVGSNMAMGMRANLPGLHHRYGPIPSYSGRGTPNQSGFFVLHGQPLGAAMGTPPAEQGQVEAQVHNQDAEGVASSQTRARTHNEAD